MTSQPTCCLLTNQRKARVRRIELETFASRYLSHSRGISHAWLTSRVRSDELNADDAYAAVGTRNSGRDDTGKAIFEGIETMWSKRTMDGLKVRGRDDLNSIVGSLFRPGIFVPLMPKASTQQKTIEKTMVQGGTFVFDGTKEIFSHYDFSNGDQPDYDEVVRIASGRA